MNPGSSVRTYGEHDQDEEKGVEHGEDRAGEGRGDLVQRPAAPARYWRSLSVRSLYDRYVLKVSGRLLYTCTDLIGSHSRHRRFGNMRHADMPARAAARTGGLNLWSSLQQPMKPEWQCGIRADLNLPKRRTARKARSVRMTLIGKTAEPARVATDRVMTKASTML